MSINCTKLCQKETTLLPILLIPIHHALSISGGLKVAPLNFNKTCVMDQLMQRAYSVSVCPSQIAMSWRMGPSIHLFQVVLSLASVYASLQLLNPSCVLSLLTISSPRFSWPILPLSFFFPRVTLTFAFFPLRHKRRVQP